MASDTAERLEAEPPLPLEHDREGGIDEAGSTATGDDEHDDTPTDLMVVSRSRRSNAGNRMSTLLATSAQEDEWGQDWEDAPDEEDFVGDEGQDQEDFNMDSSSSEEDDEAGDEDAEEKELRKAERQERTKKRKHGANPFTARLAAAARKRVRLDVPTSGSPTASAARPKKRSERASWIPTEEDGPVRTSSRRQTVANKASTIAKLKEKDRKRDDTLAMMKAAEARKGREEPRALSQAERLAEAARVEKSNSKSLHRWEELEEQRAAERQAKIDALKNRQIEGPFVRFYSGPAIWVDDRIKYTGKDAPSVEVVDEKVNKEPIPVPEMSAGTDNPIMLNGSTHDDAAVDTTVPQMPPIAGGLDHTLHTSQPAFADASQPDPFADNHAASAGGDLLAGQEDPFLSGLEQYAEPHPPQTHPEPQSSTAHIPNGDAAPSEFPPNPFSTMSQPPFPHSYPPYDDPLASHPATIPPSHLLSSFQQHPPTSLAPPKRKVVVRALRNLLVLKSFSSLTSPSISSRIRTTASLTREKDKASLVNLCAALFHWSTSDASAFVTSMLTAPKTKKDRDALAALSRPRKTLCAVSNKEARYKDPETGIAYRDSRAFGVLRGVVGGGFVWCGELGCYVGGRSKPMRTMGKGFSGMAPARGVPSRFAEMLPRGVVASNGEAGGAMPSATTTASAVASAGAVEGPGRTPGHTHTHIQTHGANESAGTGTGIGTKTSSGAVQTPRSDVKAE